MSENQSDGKRPNEKLFPQISLRFVMGIVTLSAVVMWIFRSAIVDQWLGAQCVAIVLVAVFACFILYAGLFSLASLFASLTGAIMEPLGRIDEERVEESSQDGGRDG